MKQKIDEPYLLHIRDAISLIEEWSSHANLDDFKHDEKLQSAIIRQIEIIGEAARKISQTSKVRAPEIPWRPIMDARNTLIHGYFSVDEERVWGMVKQDIPKLKEQILNLLKTV